MLNRGLHKAETSKTFRGDTLTCGVRLSVACMLKMTTVFFS